MDLKDRHQLGKVTYFRTILTLATVATCLRLASTNDAAAKSNVTPKVKNNDVICGTQFYDTASSTYLAHTVVVAKVERAVPANTTSHFLYQIQVTKRVKPRPPKDLSSAHQEPGRMLVGRFAHKQNKAACIASKVKVGAEYIFYLKKGVGAEERGGGGAYAEISSFPELVSDKKIHSMMGMICEKKKCGTPANVVLTPPHGVEIQKFLEEEFELACLYSGRPMPRLLWYKDGLPLTNKNSIRHFPHNKTSSVWIEKLSMKNAGVYTCEATNAFSSSKQSLTLKVVKSHSTLCSNERQKLCFNGGTCYNHSGKEYCHCPIEYEGTRCQKFNLQIRKNQEAPDRVVTRERVIMMGLLMGTILLSGTLLFVVIRCWSINKRLQTLEQRTNIETTRNSSLPHIPTPPTTLLPSPHSRQTSNKSTTADDPNQSRLRLEANPSYHQVLHQDISDHVENSKNQEFKLLLPNHVDEATKINQQIKLQPNHIDTGSNQNLQTLLLPNHVNSGNSKNQQIQLVPNHVDAGSTQNQQIKLLPNHVDSGNSQNQKIPLLPNHIDTGSKQRRKNYQLKRPSKLFEQRKEDIVVDTEGQLLNNNFNINNLARTTELKCAF